MSKFLAIDLGAESGRAMLGTLEGGKLELEELHRFLNTPVRLPRVSTGIPFACFTKFVMRCRSAGGSERSRWMESASIRGASILRCSAPMGRWWIIRVIIAIRATTEWWRSHLRHRAPR